MVEAQTTPWEWVIDYSEAVVSHTHVCELSEFKATLSLCSEDCNMWQTLSRREGQQHTYTPLLLYHKFCHQTLFSYINVFLTDTNQLIYLKYHKQRLNINVINLCLSVKYVYMEK